MRILFLPLATELEREPSPEEGALTRAVARELARRLDGTGEIEAVFRPFLHVVDGRRRFGVYGQRWPEEDLKRLVEDAPEVDLLVHGDLTPGDPFGLTIEVLSLPGLVRVAEETFSAPRYDGFAVLTDAVRFVAQCAETEAGPADEFPTRKFDAFLDLLRGRDQAFRLDGASPPEDPESVFEPYFDAIDAEAGLTAGKAELAGLALTAAAEGLLPLPACEAAVRRLLEADRKCVHAWSALGRLREMAEDAVEAEEALRTAVDLEPGRASLRYDLGALLLRHGRTSRAVKILETVKSDPQLGPDALLDIGSIRAAKGDAEAAIAAWREAVARNPDLGLAWANLGRLLVTEGRLDEAEEAFEQGFALPTPPRALRRAAGIYLSEQNRYKDAIEQLREALRAEGTDALIHFHLGRCYEAAGEKARALHHLRKALASGGEAADRARTVLSEFTNVAREEKLLAEVASAIQRPPEEQVVLLKGLLKEEAKYPEAQIRLGIALLAVKKARAAEKRFRKALKMVPEDPEAWSGLATVLKSRRKWKEAEEAHRKAIDLAPTQAGYHLNLADTFLRQNRKEDAAAEIQHARALAPTHPLLPDFLDALYGA